MKTCLCVDDTNRTKKRKRKIFTQDSTMYFYIIVHYTHVNIQHKIHNYFTTHTHTQQ